VLLLFDVFGPRFDWAAHLHMMPQDATGFTLGLAFGIGGILTGLPLLKRAGQLLDVAPLRVLGAISYSLFLIHPFYLLANFPELGVLSEFRVFPTKDLSAPIWYLPLVFFPGVVAWSIVVFLLIERPGIKLGARLIRRSSTQGAGR
jgi:peptidoglycan/LPS O-acetylase OafA/YrhL